jgi:hypothetical protein
MALIDGALASLRDLNFWIKVKRGTALTLAELPGIIPLRWPYFRDNWETIKLGLTEKIPQASDPNGLAVEIETLSSLIEVQRSSQNQTVNPFSRSSTLNKYLNVFSNTLINDLPLTKEENTILDTELVRIRGFIKTDFRALRDEIIIARNQLADTVGGNDDSYDATFNRSALTKLKDITPADIQNMQALQNGIKTIDYILANARNILTTVSIDPFALARQNANNDALQIETGRSALLVKMNFGDDLESLAQRYLNNSDRWMEIATANGLRPPFIDEIGQKVLLLSNGNGNQVNVAAEDTNGNANLEKFYIGQQIFLQSDTEKFPDQRSVVNIKEVPVSGELVLELSGENDLGKYKIIENANIRVYLPNTINSLFLVQIPTSEEASLQPGEEPFFLSDKSEDEKRAGVDLALNNSFDLVLTPTSDFQLSFGVPNAVQAIKIKMVSEQGQNSRHSTFGLVSLQGRKFADTAEAIEEITTSINGMIEVDPRFERVESLRVSKVKSALLVQLEVLMAGSGTVVPISFSVNTG